MSERTLNEIAKAIVAEGKGLLASDESSGNIKKQFERLGVEDTAENHRRYREMLYTTADFEKHVSGVILFDETIRQSTSGGMTIPQYLSSKGVIPGIKPDIGVEEMPGHPGEQIGKRDATLDARLKEYYQLGARFAKWRVVINIGENFPTDECIEENCKILTEFSLLCQANNIVPIPEPEVIMEGTHTIDRCLEVTTRTLKTLFAQLKQASVDLSGLILKPNMVVYSSKGEKVSPEVVAEKTLQCFRESVPAEVPGIVFLSGGQDEVEACVNLSAIAKLAKEQGTPWKLTFSFGRGLQNSAMKNWSGKDENVSSSQEIFTQRLVAASAASLGEFKVEIK